MFSQLLNTFKRHCMSTLLMPPLPADNCTAQRLSTTIRPAAKSTSKPLRTTPTFSFSMDGFVHSSSSPRRAAQTKWQPRLRSGATSRNGGSKSERQHGAKCSSHRSCLQSPAKSFPQMMAGHPSHQSNPRHQQTVCFPPLQAETKKGSLNFSHRNQGDGRHIVEMTKTRGERLQW